MLMRKLGIYEFGGRNVLYLMFKTFSSYCPYQKRLAETICYSEIVKPNILSRKLKLRKKKRKKKEVCVKHQHRNDRWWRDIGHPKLCLMYYGRKIFGCHGRSLLNSYWRSLLWNSFAVLKLLKALSKFSARSSDHLNVVFERAAATCSLLLLAILFFNELFCIRIHQSSEEKGNPNKEHIRNTRKDSNNNTRKKITVIGDSMVKFLRSHETSSINNAINVMKHPGSITDGMIDYARPVTRKKPDVIIMDVGTNDLIKRVNTMSKVRKIVSAIQEIDSTRNIQPGFSSIVQRAGKYFSREIKDINTRLKSYCLGKGLIFVDNSSIDESWLNNSKLHLSKKRHAITFTKYFKISRRPLKHVSTNNREWYQKQPSLMFSRFLSGVQKPSYRESCKSNICIP